MRMWMVPPIYLCNKHLLGEHVETHMFVGHLKLGRRLGAYASLCEPHRLVERHDELAAELRARGFIHKSPLEFEYSGTEVGHVDIDRSIADLRARCPDCSWLIDEATRESL